MGHRRSVSSGKGSFWNGLALALAIVIVFIVIWLLFLGGAQFIATFLSGTL